MKVLELFAGTRSIGKAFEARGHEVYSIEWDKRFNGIDWYEDIGKITAEDILTRFGHPDVIWASPDCSSYSVAAISRHRRREANGNLAPISDYAKFCDEVNAHVVDLIRELAPKYWFIENPRGGATEDGFHAKPPALHSYLLPIRRNAHEADRHMDEPSEPAVQTAVPLWGSVPRTRAKGVTNRDAEA